MPNFNESRVAKGGLGKLNPNYVFPILKVVVVDLLRASGGIVSKTVLVESEENYSD